MILVFNEDQAVLEWTRRRVPWCDGFGGARAIGIAKDGRLICGVVYSNYRKTSIEVTIASDNPAWCRRGIIGGLLAYPFFQLGVRRITCLIPARNERSLKLCLGLGFRAEGRARDAFPDDDAVICGMTRKDASRWLPKGLDHAAAA